MTPLDLQEDSHFVAFGEFDAFDAVGPYLMGQGSLVHHLEAVLLEEIGPVGQGEDPVNAPG